MPGAPEGPSVPPPAEVRPPQLEVVQNPEAEQKPSRQRQEGNLVTQSLLGRAARETEERKDKLAAENIEQAKKMVAEPGVRPLLTLGAIQDLPEGEDLEFDLKPLSLQQGEKMLKITGVRRQGNDFVCTIEGQDQPITLSRQEIFDAQLLDEADVILAQFQPGAPERDLLELQIKFLREGEGALTGQDVDKTITEAARKLGILTAEDFRKFINREYPELQESLALSITAEQALLRKQQREKVFEVLEGKNTIGFQEMKDVFKAIGVSPEDMLGQTNTIVQRLEAQARANPGNEALAKELAKAKAMQNFWQRGVDAIKENGPIQKDFERAAQGLIKPEQADQLAKALQEGKLEDILLALIPGLDDPRKQKEMLDYFKTFGMGAGILAMLLHAFTKEITEGSPMGQ